MSLAAIAFTAWLLTTSLHRIIKTWSPDLNGRVFITLSAIVSFVVVFLTWSVIFDIFDRATTPYSGAVVTWAIVFLTVTGVRFSWKSLGNHKE